MEVFLLGKAAGNGDCAGRRCGRVFPELGQVSQSRHGRPWGAGWGRVGDVSEAYSCVRGGGEW